MKKSTSLLLVVFLVVNTLVLSVKFTPPAKATYVEGNIDQDVLWALIDSPFIVVNNVTVLPGATLTIEPGVEVRFGGNFSLNVLGKLVAKGTNEKPITFTSNRPEGLRGDWIGMIFNEASESQMDYCIVKYAVNGLTIENSVLEVSNSEFIENKEAGVKIIGNSSLTMTNSKIMLNEVGVLPVNLNLNSPSQVSLTNTVVSSNNYGIYIESSVNNFNIQNCTLMSNEAALYLSGDANIDFTYNSIAYNKIGVLIGNLSSYPVIIHYNDIYNNTEIAMKLDNSIASTGQLMVDAAYNYWGDASGPYHPTLNPYGKGNPVESNGVDIDFIPFLSRSIHLPNNPPTAHLLTDKIRVAPNQEVLFIGTNSSDDGRVDYYLFEFGDGKTSDWTTLSVFTHKYLNAGIYTAKLTVLDDFGARSSNPAQLTIIVEDLPALEASLSLSAASVGYLETVTVTVQVTSGGSPVENASIRLFSVKGGRFENSYGITDATGRFVTTFTAPNVTKATDILIVASVSKENHVDGSDRGYLRILPPLTVNMDVEPETVKSEYPINVNVTVTHLNEPISNATIQLYVNDTFLEEAITDLNGFCSFVFAAPTVNEETNLMITAVASKEGYKEDTVQAVIVVEPKDLAVQVIADPQVIFSNESSTVSVYVSYENWPVIDAQVSVSASLGTLSLQTGFTDLYGEFRTKYFAPIVYEETTVTLDITVTKDGYRSFSTQFFITVEPKVLEVEIGVFPETVASERSFNVTVYVTFNDQPVPGVNVSLTSSVGNLSAFGLTNSEGICKFTFTAPLVNQAVNSTILVEVSKTSYVSANASGTVTFKPGILTFEVNIDPIVAVPGGEVALTVHVRCDSLDVENALVTVTSSIGNLSQYTNSSGLCVFRFNAPEVTEEITLEMTVAASKDGYSRVQGVFYLYVAPPGGPSGGIPVIFLIAGIVVLVIVVVVALLFKLGIIEFGAGEEEGLEAT